VKYLKFVHNIKFDKYEIIIKKWFSTWWNDICLCNRKWKFRKY